MQPPFRVAYEAACAVFMLGFDVYGKFINFVRQRFDLTRYYWWKRGFVLPVSLLHLIPTVCSLFRVFIVVRKQNSTTTEGSSK